MRGSVRKRGTTWTWYVDGPPEPLTGKRRQASKGGFRTKREAQQALNEVLARLRDGTFVPPSQLPRVSWDGWTKVPSRKWARVTLSAC